MVGKFIWDSAYFQGRLLFVVGGVSKGMGWNKRIPYQIQESFHRMAPETKKNGGIDQARKWTKSSLNDDTFGDGRCQQISPSQR